MTTLLSSHFTKKRSVLVRAPHEHSQNEGQTLSRPSKFHPSVEDFTFGFDTTAVCEGRKECPSPRSSFTFDFEVSSNTKNNYHTSNDTNPISRDYELSSVSNNARKNKKRRERRKKHQGPNGITRKSGNSENGNDFKDQNDEIGNMKTNTNEVVHNDFITDRSNGGENSDISPTRGIDKDGSDIILKQFLNQEKLVDCSLPAAADVTSPDMDQGETYLSTSHNKYVKSNSNGNSYGNIIKKKKDSGRIQTTTEEEAGRRNDVLSSAMNRSVIKGATVSSRAKVSNDTSSNDHDLNMPCRIENEMTQHMNGKKNKGIRTPGRVVNEERRSFRHRPSSGRQQQQQQKLCRHNEQQKRTKIQFNSLDRGRAMVNRSSIAIHKSKIGGIGNSSWSTIVQPAIIVETTATAIDDPCAKIKEKNRYTSNKNDNPTNNNAFTFGFNFRSLLLKEGNATKNRKSTTVKKS